MFDVTIPSTLYIWERAPNARGVRTAGGSRWSTAVCADGAAAQGSEPAPDISIIYKQYYLSIHTSRASERN